MEWPTISECMREPGLKEIWGVGVETIRPTLRLEVRGQELHLHSHPDYFIPGTVLNWFRGYHYQKTFPGTALSFEEVSPRWVRAWEIYENYLSECLELKRPKA